MSRASVEAPAQRGPTSKAQAAQQRRPLQSHRASGVLVCRRKGRSKCKATAGLGPLGTLRTSTRSRRLGGPKEGYKQTHYRSTMHACMTHGCTMHNT
eukprot:176638-Lingulodinium_polyedra.AAC.1